MSAEEAGRIARAAARMRRAGRMPLKVALPTVAALGAGAAVAVGSIAGSGGTITGCVNTLPDGTTPGTGQFEPYGALRVINPSLEGTDVSNDEWSCAEGEQTITWNQQGPQGPQGEQGPAGSAGAPGAKGSTGAPGTPGSASINGETALTFEASKTTRLLLDASGLTSKGVTLESFGIGIEQPVVVGSGAAKATVQTFGFVMKRNAVATTLINDEQRGTRINTATFEVDHVGKASKLAQVEKLELSEVYIKNIVEKGDTVTVGGVFAKDRMTVGSGNNTVSGKLSTPVATGWDLTQSKTP